jgi:hypothetical protein
MHVQLVCLDGWISNQYKSYPSMTEVDKKTDAASILNCSVSTLYKWIASGNVFIQEFCPDIGGDGGGVVVWRHGKFID